MGRADPRLYSYRDHGAGGVQLDGLAVELGDNGHKGKGRLWGSFGRTKEARRGRGRAIGCVNLLAVSRCVSCEEHRQGKLSR